MQYPHALHRSASILTRFISNLLPWFVSFLKKYAHTRLVSSYTHIFPMKLQAQNPLHISAEDICLSRPERAEEKSGRQPLGISLAYRRTHLTGQRAPHAPPGAEAGGVAQSSIPRPPAYLRNTGPSERGGHQDGVRDAGTLLGGVHPGHLCPRHHIGPEGSGEDHGKSSGECPLTPEKRQEARRRKYRLRADFLPRLGHGLGHPSVQKTGTSKKVAKVNKNHRFPAGKR